MVAVSTFEVSAAASVLVVSASPHATNPETEMAIANIREEKVFCINIFFTNTIHL
jgi:hypothetical protein